MYGCIKDYLIYCVRSVCFLKLNITLCLLVFDVVMALDMRSRKAKRLLEEHDDENCKGDEEVQAMDNCHRLCPLIAETGNIGLAMQAMHQSKSMKSRNDQPLMGNFVSNC